jgi:hypothetical protein
VAGNGGALHRASRCGASHGLAGLYARPGRSMLRGQGAGTKARPRSLRWGVVSLLALSLAPRYAPPSAPFGRSARVRVPLSGLALSRVAAPPLHAGGATAHAGPHNPALRRAGQKSPYAPPACCRRLQRSKLSPWRRYPRRRHGLPAPARRRRRAGAGNHGMQARSMMMQARLSRPVGRPGRAGQTRPGPSPSRSRIFRPSERLNPVSTTVDKL